MSIELYWLGKEENAAFPEVSLALDEPDGLLAAGGDLSETRLLNAYRNGIFPWFSDGQAILWWSPNPRMVFRTDGIHLSKKFKRQLKTASQKTTQNAGTAQCRHEINTAAKRQP